MASGLPKITEQLAEKSGIVNRTWYRFLARIERLIDGATNTPGTGLTVTTSGALTIATNGVSNTMLAQGAALSVVGVTGNATANRGDITATSGSMFLQRDRSNQVVFRYPQLPAFSVTTVPSAVTAGSGSLIYVYDEIGGKTVAFSDGAAWRRVQDLAIIS